MKILLNVLIFILFFCYVVHGRILQKRTINSEEDTAYCHSDRKEVGAMELGEEVILEDGCGKAVCSVGPHHGPHITYYSCTPLHTSSSGCKQEPDDLSKPYPDCCGKIICG